MLKDFIKYILFIIGLRKTVPSRYINRIKIKENNEKLVIINDTPNLFFAPDLKKTIYLRESVYQKIKDAAKKLPEGYFFKIYSAYRPMEEQKRLWKKNYAIMKQNNPTASKNELTQMTKAVCADPRKGFGGHQTGGAVDISLCDNNGINYNMGTNYLETSDKIKTNAKNISAEAKKNRKILYNALTSLDFVNYPNEWWHFCYGDRMWAAYKKKNFCFYGIANIL